MGRRMELTRMCETMPIAGRMAMYTSGWPKNQNRCCHSRGDPPEWGWIWSLTTRSAGMKKLVPASRSRMSSTQAGSSTAKASSAIQAVMNHAQVESGIRISVMPRARRSSVVEMKFSEPSNEAMQNVAIESAHSVWPVCSPGPDRSHGAQRRVRGPSEMAGHPRRKTTQSGNKSHERDPERHHVEARERHILGADLDRQKKLPNAAKGALVSTKNTISVPCMVISDR